MVLDNSSTSLDGATALVTGASGFIGSHLCDELVARGVRVSAVSRARKDESAAAVQWIQADLVDVAAVKRIVQDCNPDLVFHLASWVSGSRDRGALRRAFDGNLLTTVNLLDALTAADCRRLILAGSLEEPFDDPATAIPGSPYAVAKWASSAYARMCQALYGTPAVIARTFMVYGPGQQDLNKVLPYVTLSLLRGESPQLGSGLRPVDWIYVGDVVEGLIIMGAADGIDGETLDLGSGALITIRDFVLQLARLVGAETTPRFGAMSDRPLEQVRVADIERTYERVGWRPATSAGDGLRYLVDWCRNLTESTSQA